jgi:FtsP/CotA-like multicopper oxidase with cupredoxin domain
MPSHPHLTRVLFALACLWALQAHAQSFRVQCPASTTLHPLVNALGQTGKPDSNLPNPHIKCQQLGGGDGFATMADGTQTYMFSFGPLSGLGNIVHGLPGTVPASEFNQSNLDSNGNVLDVVKIGAPDSAAYAFNGAIGLSPDINAEQVGSITFVVDPTTDLPITGTGYAIGDALVFTDGGGSGAVGIVSAVSGTGAITAISITNPGQNYTQAPDVTITSVHGRGAQPIASLVMATNAIDGHVDPRLIMDVGVMNGNIPAPMISIEEGDELFLTLTNVGMVMRPDLFEQHTVHFHGYPNASAFYDGVPDASVAINIGGSFTYYYLAPEAGTYMWHCHISPPEHLQMGMVGQLYVRPRQNNVGTGSLMAASVAAQQSIDTKCSSSDMLCSTQVPAVDTGAVAVPGAMYAFDDGDGTTAYDVEYPIQMHGFDPNFHFVGMTFNPESFVDTKDKFFLLNGRSYPDTVNPAPLSTQASDGTAHFSQPLSSLVNIPLGGKALLRFSDLNVTEYHTLSSLGIPMHVVGYNARLLRDQDGNNTDYFTNSISLAGGESADVILDAHDTTAYPAGSVFYLYTPQLDHLANDAENFGGMMTEVHVLACTPANFNSQTKQCK